MTTYFHGGNPEMETDGIQTLYLMNPNYITAHNSASSEHHHQQQLTATTQQQQNMILLNSAMSRPHVSQAPPSLQSQFLTLPFAHPISADDPSRFGNGFHYNSWASGSSGGNSQVEMSGAVAVAGNFPYQIQIENNNTSDMFRHPVVLSPTMNQQGLSLTLSSQPGLGGVDGSSSSSAVQVAIAGIREDSGNNGVTNFIIGSKYLKAAKELLDEVVNVGKTAITETVKKEKEKMVQLDNINNGENEAAGNNDTGGGSSQAASAELSITQRQEIQMKKTKLISMLDEVEQRYRKYHHQMKTVVTSFEQVAGFGSARSYTSLALRTISKQFRCLKDAITSQIMEASKSLGEQVGEDCLGVKEEGSRLRMIDHQIHQQRALQQLGMIQHNAWRPQRGLPERAVSVLRAWLFEHFLHPYPKDSDKHMLAKQTGLTRNQVSNWFINARVRLWKPMVEEMYLEEVKDHSEQKGSNQDISNNNAGSSNIGKRNDPNYKQHQPSTNGQQPVGRKTQNASPNDISNNSTISTSPNAAASFQAPPPPGFSLIGSSSSDIDGLLLYNKKPRGSAPETENSPSSILSAGEINFSRHNHQNNDLMAKFGAGSVGYTIGQDHNNSNNNDDRFGAYHHQLGDQLGRFNPNHHHQQMAQSFHHSNNGNVSLTLGLPPGENLQQSYFSSQNIHGFDRRIEMVGNGGGEADDHSNMGFQQGSSPHSIIGFQNMDIQNRKRYAAAPLLPDNFVA